MADRVVDASAICAIIYDEPMAPDVLARIATGTLFAPALLALEVANVCVTKLRTNPSGKDKILRQFAEFSAFDIREANVPSTTIIQNAVDLSLPAYDASYLALALQLNAQLVTLDKRLAAAAAKIGVRT